MKSESQDVGDFFNSIAENYREKYTHKDVFRNYFFNERLVEATRGFDFESKNVLDIGAGTGNLYDRLMEIDPSVNYFALDIAAEMLQKSLIPADRQFIGEFGKTKLPLETYDYIFLLGVTTYMDAEKLSGLFDLIFKSLSPGGQVIITFTNKNSLDWKLRRIFKMLPKRFLPQTFVLTQAFTIYPRTLGQINNAIKNSYDIKDIRWLNHTIFPFNQIFKSLSAKFAKNFHKRTMKSNDSITEKLSSDFLIVLGKKDNI